MTKQQLENRIAFLETEKEKAISNVNAIIGAINDCRYWISELDKVSDNKSQAESEHKPEVEPEREISEGE